MNAAKLVLLADTLLLLYAQMLRIRRSDERLVRSYHEGLLPGEYFSGAGAEAVYVGVSHHLQEGDLVFGNQHVALQAIAQGMPLSSVFAEAYGRALGPLGGRVGAASLTDPVRGVFGSGGSASAGLLHAAGAAYALQTLKRAHVAVCYFGDTASACGAFHEVLNVAGLYKLPLLLVYQRNGYAGRAPLAQVVAGVKMAVRAKNYDVHGAEVDGHDVSSVYAAAFEGLRRAREGRGATLLECVTSRLRPHSEGELAEPAEESASGHAAAGVDPIAALQQRLVASEFATSAELSAEDAQLRREVDAAHREALASEPGVPYELPAQGNTHHG